MARPGVTYSDVANAAAEIAGQNQNPTIERVRRIIGHGSTTTLATHLRRWKAEQAGDSLMAAREGIPEPLVSVMKGLWERVMQEADSKMEKLSNEYENTISTLKEELSKYKTNNQKWQKLHDQWLQDKEKLQTDVATQTERNASLKQQYSTLETRWETQIRQIEEKEARIAELNRLHQQAQQNLEHYRESVREQRLAESIAAEKREAALQLDIAGLKSALAESQKGKAASEKALTVLQSECASLRETIGKEREEKEQVQQAKRVLENAHIRLQATHDGLIKQESCLQERYSEAESRVLELEKNTVALNEQLQFLHDKLKKAEDRVSVLEHEKQFWEQKERAIANRKTSEAL